MLWPHRPVTPQRATLLTAILGSGVAFLDGSVVNVALPAMAADLGAGLTAQQWIVEAYLLTLSAFLLIGGSAGDLFGERRVFRAGVALFGLTSVACGAAPSDEVLIVARALQGMAGALLVPASLALITTTFDGHERAAAIGTWTAWTGVAFIIGPLGGGALVETATWRWIFLINVPLVAVTLLLSRRVPAAPGAGGRLDLTGAALCALGLAGVVVGLLEERPVVAVAGAAVLAAFVAWERRAPAPMLPLSIFRARNFAVGNAATLLVYGGLGASTFLLAIFLQQVAGYSAVEAGLALLPVTLVMLVAAGRFGALAERTGPRVLMAAGPAVGGAGMLWIAAAGPQVDYARELLGGVLVLGLGLAMTVAPLTATVLGAADASRAGIASATNNAVARVAALLAIAAVGLVVTAAYRDGAPAALRDEPLRGGPAAQASADGFRAGMIASALLMFAGAGISAVGIASPPRPPQSLPA